MRRDGNRSAEKLKSEIAGAERHKGKTRATFNMTRVSSGSVNSRSRWRGARQAGGTNQTSEVRSQKSEVRGQIERKRRLRSSCKKFVELVVRPNPCPLDSITAPFSDDTNIPTYSYRPIIGVTAELFELKRIVSGIF